MNRARARGVFAQRAPASTLVIETIYSPSRAYVCMCGRNRVCVGCIRKYVDGIRRDGGCGWSYFMQGDW
jgi:hypothetical protein